MSYLEHSVKTTPSGLRKILYLDWPLVVLLTTVACVGFLMLYSVAGGNAAVWTEPQMKRFALGLVLMFAIAMVPAWFWRNVSLLAYLVSLALLLLVMFFGVEGKGAQRWLDLGGFRLQPSELVKITLVMVMAAYYDWLPVSRVSRPVWVVIPVAFILAPVAMVLRQPDLGTSILLLLAGGMMMFVAGVHWAYFAVVILGGAALVAVVLQSRGTDWQLLENYQFRRIDTFLNPESDPLGAGYHITQSKIALGSGGWTGRGFMQGTQSRLNFLPEKHTDFIFVTLAEAQMQRELRHPEMEKRTTVTIDARFSAVPSDFLAPVRLHLTTKYRALDLVSVDEMARRRAENDDAAGEPTRYAVVAGEFEFQPTPDASYTLELYYRRTLPALSDANTSNWLLDRAPDAYLYGALLQSAPYLQEDGRVQTWAALYREAIQGLNREAERHRYGGTGKVRAIRTA